MVLWSYFINVYKKRAEITLVAIYQVYDWEKRYAILMLETAQ